MANYIYNTYLFKAGASVIDEDPDNATNLADFETNHKAAAQDVSDIIIQELTFDTFESYTTFESYINGDITWADVKYIDRPDRYELYIATTSAL